MVELGAALTAISMGALTVLHPCPLATNLAALATVCAWQEDRKARLKVAFALVAGLMVSYSLVGFMLVKSILSAPTLVHILNHSLGYFFGPLLMVLGAHFANWIKLPFSNWQLPWEIIRKQEWQVTKTFALGLIIALVFCPFSAGIFAGVLIPMAVEKQSSLLLPLLYGFGAGLPILVIVFLINFGQKTFEAKNHNTHLFGKKFQQITGVILIGIGVYFSVTRLYLPIFS